MGAADPSSNDRAACGFFPFFCSSYRMSSTVAHALTGGAGRRPESGCLASIGVASACLF